MKISKHTNKLIHESSPYLLQHAHNPVDWYPWGEEALAKAAQEDKPIIVSIGYSACHWCHVMERESFENEAVAELMNQYFVCVKVDREERPDVDQIYMDAAQTMGLQGGWPLNVFLTSDQKPFYGGTYFPQENWKQLLENIADAYAQQRQALVESAEKFTEALNFSEIEKYRLKDSDEALHRADSTIMFQTLAEKFDRVQGGMKGAPKFPMPGIWRFVLHYLSLQKTENTRRQAEEQLATTLNEMAAGGIYDQVDGGFSRYSVDKDWFAPHFEKMLYDNGQLVSLYAEAFRLYKNERYKAVVYETVAFVEREMMNAEGGFYAALDADSEGVEGKFYTWTWEEFANALGKDTNLWAAYYGVTKEGNWENSRNILHTTYSLSDFAQKEGQSEEDLKAKLKEAKKKLNAIRAERIKPGLDDKVLTGWNGIMLKGVVDAYGSFGEDKFLQLALKNAHFIKEKLFFTSNTLCRTYKEGKASLNGYLEDYAQIIRAYTSLYQVTFDEQWLSISRQLLDYVLEHFYDPAENLFFFTDNSEKLIARKKEIFDNVIPASNSVMAENLYDLSILLDREDWRKVAVGMVSKVKKLVVGEPRYMNNWATVYLKMAYPTAEIVTVGPAANRTPIDFGQYPLFNLIFAGTEDVSTLPLLLNRTAIDGQKTIYVCYNKACQLPVHNVAEALAQVE